MKIKALSLHSPWTEKIRLGDKFIETRTWNTSHRGPLLICESKNPPGRWPGQAVALVNMVDCRPMTEADAAAACCPVYPDAKAWVFDWHDALDPFPVRGRQGLFTVDLDAPEFADLPAETRWTIETALRDQKGLPPMTYPTCEADAPETPEEETPEETTNLPKVCGNCPNFTADENAIDEGWCDYHPGLLLEATEDCCEHFTPAPEPSDTAETPEEETTEATEATETAENPAVDENSEIENPQSADPPLIPDAMAETLFKARREVAQYHELVDERKELLKEAKDFLAGAQRHLFQLVAEAEENKPGPLFAGAEDENVDPETGEVLSDDADADREAPEPAAGPCDQCGDLSDGLHITPAGSLCPACIGLARDEATDGHSGMSPETIARGRAVKLADMAAIAPTARKNLTDAGLLTIGDVADHDGPLENIHGIGPAAAQIIADACAAVWLNLLEEENAPADERNPADEETEPADPGKTSPEDGKEPADPGKNSPADETGDSCPRVKITTDTGRIYTCRLHYGEVFDNLKPGELAVSAQELDDDGTPMGDMDGLKDVTKPMGYLDETTPPDTRLLFAPDPDGPQAVSLVFEGTTKNIRTGDTLAILRLPSGETWKGENDQPPTLAAWNSLYAAYVQARTTPEPEGGEE